MSTHWGLRLRASLSLRARNAKGPARVLATRLKTSGLSKHTEAAATPPVLISKTIVLHESLSAERAIVFAKVCEMGLEGNRVEARRRPLLKRNSRQWVKARTRGFCGVSSSRQSRQSHDTWVQMGSGDGAECPSLGSHTLKASEPEPCSPSQQAGARPPDSGVQDRRGRSYQHRESPHPSNPQWR